MSGGTKISDPFRGNDSAAVARSKAREHARREESTAAQSGVRIEIIYRHVGTPRRAVSRRLCETSLITERRGRTGRNGISRRAPLSASIMIINR